MSKWIAEFDLEDGDTMPEHMDLNYMGAKIDFYCRPMWIPVSERLPEIHNYMQEYIVTIKGNFIRTAFFTETNGKSWWSIDNVKAWMHLPEPYKEDEE